VLALPHIATDILLRLKALCIVTKLNFTPNVTAALAKIS
jgi:hypothetical protein